MIVGMSLSLEQYSYVLFLVFCLFICFQVCLLLSFIVFFLPGYPSGLTRVSISYWSYIFAPFLVLFSSHFSCFSGLNTSWFSIGSCVTGSQVRSVHVTVPCLQPTCGPQRMLQQCLQQPQTSGNNGMQMVDLGAQCGKSLPISLCARMLSS